MKRRSDKVTGTWRASHDAKQRLVLWIIAPTQVPSSFAPLHLLE